MPRTRTELLVKEAFIDNMTWRDLESLFSLNKSFLLDELQSFFLNLSDGKYNFYCICDKIASNQRILNAEYER